MRSLYPGTRRLILVSLVDGFIRIFRESCDFLTNIRPSIVQKELIRLSCRSLLRSLTISCRVFVSASTIVVPFAFLAKFDHSANTLSIKVSYKSNYNVCFSFSDRAKPVTARYGFWTQNNFMFVTANFQNRIQMI